MTTTMPRSIDLYQNVPSLFVAYNLNKTYGALGASVARLSSGLRVLSAADDPAGLAVAETMDADIAALSQGKRNAMDGISALQTADSALGQIDLLTERMSELTEQASTGTYTDAQKLIMQNEYDSLADEITRIANQMDFNGVNLLNNSNSTRISVGSGATIRGSYIQINSQKMDAASLGIGGTETFVENKNDSGVVSQDSNFINFGAQAGDSLNFTFAGGTYVGFGTSTGSTQTITVTSMSISLVNTTGVNGVNSVSTTASGATYYIGTGAETLSNVVTAINSAASTYASATSQTQFENWSPAQAYLDASNNRYYLDVSNSVNGTWNVTGLDSGAKTHLQTNAAGTISAPSASDFVNFADGTSSMTFTFGAGSYVGVVNGESGQTTQTLNLEAMQIVVDGDTGAASVSGTVATVHMGGTGGYSLDSVVSAINSAATAYAAENTEFAGWTPAQAMQLASGQYTLDISHAAEGSSPTVAAAAASVTFGTGSTAVTYTASTAGATSAIRFSNSIANGASGSAMNAGDWGQTIGSGVTQDLVHNPARATVAIENAIATKDNYRSYIGYTTNRLESASDSLDMQVLDLAEAVARIMDVDVASETAILTRNLVLAQAGAASLAISNDLPQLALPLLKFKL